VVRSAPAKQRADLHRAFLVAETKRGKKKAFQALAKQCDSRFLAHSWRLVGEREGARDVTQEAWIEILRSLGNLRDEYMFLPWGYRIVSRCAARWIKQQQRKRNIFSSQPCDESKVAANSSLSEVETSISLAQAIEMLSADARATLSLFYTEGFSLAETSVALDVPVGTIKSRLSHARNNLREIMERNEK